MNMYRHTILHACMWYECVLAWEVPNGGYGYERGCRGRVLDMCGKVVRKEGMGRDSSKLQYKVSLMSLTQPLYFVG